MIDPQTPDIGRTVTYHPGHGAPVERGFISAFSVKEGFVFVTYGDPPPPTASGKLTPCDKLEWAA